MINKRTLQVLDKLKRISDSTIFTYPKMCITGADNGTICYLDLEALDVTPFDTFGIHALNEFTSILNLFEDPDISLTNNLMTISEGNKKITYAISSPEVLGKFSVPETILEKIESAEEVGIFNIPATLMKEMQSAGSVLKSDEFFIKGTSDGDMSVSLRNKDDRSGREFSTVVYGKSNTDFSLVLVNERVRSLPEDEYDITVRKNPVTGTLITRWTSRNYPIKIVIAEKPQV